MKKPIHDLSAHNNIRVCFSFIISKCINQKYTFGLDNKKRTERKQWITAALDKVFVRTRALVWLINFSII